MQWWLIAMLAWAVALTGLMVLLSAIFRGGQLEDRARRQLVLGTEAARRAYEGRDGAAIDLTAQAA